MLQGILTIPPFAILFKKIKIASFRVYIKKKREEEEEMRFRQRNAPLIKSKKFLPIIPLEKLKLATDDKDKSAFISFDLKVRAGASAKDSTYKKFMRTFEEGTRLLLHCFLL